MSGERQRRGAGGPATLWRVERAGPFFFLALLHSHYSELAVHLEEPCARCRRFAIASAPMPSSALGPLCGS